MKGPVTHSLAELKHVADLQRPIYWSSPEAVGLKAQLCPFSWSSRVLKKREKKKKTTTTQWIRRANKWILSLYYCQQWRREHINYGYLTRRKWMGVFLRAGLWSGKLRSPVFANWPYPKENQQLVLQLGGRHPMEVRFLPSSHKDWEIRVLSFLMITWSKSWHLGPCKDIAGL